MQYTRLKLGFAVCAAVAPTASWHAALPATAMHRLAPRECLWAATTAALAPEQMSRAPSLGASGGGTVGEIQIGRGFRQTSYFYHPVYTTVQVRRQSGRIENSCDTVVRRLTVVRLG